MRRLISQETSTLIKPDRLHTCSTAFPSYSRPAGRAMADDGFRTLFANAGVHSTTPPRSYCRILSQVPLSGSNS